VTPVRTVRVADVMAARVNVDVFGVVAAICFVVMMMVLFLLLLHGNADGTRIQNLCSL